MSQEKTLDNTQAIMKELEKGKSDNTPSSSTTKSTSVAPTNKKSKSKKASSSTDSSGTSITTTDTIENIQNVLADPAIKKDFLGNVTELLCGYQRKKPTDKEVQSVKDMIEDGLLSKVFHVKKTVI